MKTNRLYASEGRAEKAESEAAGLARELRFWASYCRSTPQKRTLIRAAEFIEGTEKKGEQDGVRQ